MEILMKWMATWRRQAFWIGAPLMISFGHLFTSEMKEEEENEEKEEEKIVEKDNIVMIVDEKVHRLICTKS